MQNESDWPLLAPLPSYGVDQNLTEGRFSSLLFGMNLTDVVITGNNLTFHFSMIVRVPMLMLLSIGIL